MLAILGCSFDSPSNYDNLIDKIYNGICISQLVVKYALVKLVSCRLSVNIHCNEPIMQILQFSSSFIWHLHMLLYYEWEVL